MRLFESFGEQAERLNDYFVAAVRCYVLKGDEVAGYAAFASGVVAASSQRTGMIAYLQRLSTALESKSSGVPPDSSEFRAQAVVKSRLDSLTSQIAAKNWGISDCVAAKKELLRLDREYYEGQGRADAAVFYRRYPDVFSEDFHERKELAGRSFCTSCGAEVDATWAYCGECGAPQSITSSDERCGLGAGTAGENRFAGVKRQKVIWKIVVGGIILAALSGSQGSVAPTTSEAEFIGYNSGRVILWIIGTCLLIAGIRGRKTRG
ncbi:zinc ribbon domain-containing protein [uncultured Paludibaculum sp.]|uniref:zinc ribbon domain-containing protein n=1 Tax=uncultured Paludibaculum sp. TaxID=1765020 RepID=UPI002AAB2B1C|nr:zinc ribbon domain-containing protein [uncultured Paludibaculum sp.]